jgi:hypothetical protein
MADAELTPGASTAVEEFSGGVMDVVIDAIFRH